MHRSGTSAVTRVLNLLGAALPADLLPPLPNNNESGFWESHTLWELHEKLLADIASSWDDPTPFPENWIESPAAVPYRNKFSEFVDEVFSDAPLGVIKDPRISRFLDLWKAGIEDTGRVPMAVIPYRNPVEVARSLKDRDQIPASRSYLMWLRHLLIAERDSRSMARAFVDYGQFLDDWMTVTNRLSRQLGVSWPCNLLKANNEIDAFLKRSQRHHREAPDALDARDDVPDWVKRTYKLLPRLDEDPTDAETLHRFDQLREELATADAAFSPAMRSYHEVEMRLTAEKELLDTKLSKQAQRISDLEKVLKARADELEKARKNTELLGERLRDLQSVSLYVNASKHVERDGSDATSDAELSPPCPSPVVPTAGPHISTHGVLGRIARGIRLAPSERTRRRQRIRRLLIDSGLFDRDFYASSNPDVVQRGLDPLEHYIRHGATEGRMTNPLFDGRFYSEQISPAELIHLDPLLHFIERGAAQGINPHPLFDVRYYADKYPAVAASGINPLAHYLNFGWKERRNPTIYFDSAYYETQLSAPLEEIGNPLVHYLETGAREGLDPHPLFSTSYYLAQNGDIREADVNPLIHYVTAGGMEGRDPHRLFDARFYLEQIRDIEDRPLEPLRHYLEIGAWCGLDPNPYFDSAFYLSRDNQLLRYRVNPLSHYVQYGAGERRAASRSFDTRLYLETNPDAAESGVNPLAHFMSRGLADGRNAPEVLPTGPGLTHPAGPMASNPIRLRESDLSSVLDMAAPPEVPLDPAMAASTRLVAFYLPQFHPIPENDRWWGAGFTEWTNVVRGQSLFNGPLQPKLPGELGFYDLRLPEVRERQAELAREHGISAFCYHYYWFNGKKLLNRPLDEVIASGKPDFPFCICWANENWTRRWDGLDREVLIAQNHSLESDRDFIREIMPILEDRRYLKVDGRPVLLVYRPELFENPAETAHAWRDECVRAGIGDIHLCAVQFRSTDPRPLGFDAACEFPPHFLKAKNITNKIARYLPGFQGRIFDLTSAVRYVLESDLNVGYTFYRGVMSGWNNIPRRLNKATVYAGNSPAHYAAWLRIAINFQQSKGAQRDNLVFINAWNEWAEGAILEPSRAEGDAYLKATLHAIDPKLSIKDIFRRQGELRGDDSSAP
jgi:hypothetical protein